MIIEDGSGKPDSNSYVTADYAATYHSDRGNDWQGGDALLVRATDYIDRQFGDRFLGFRTDPEQSLEWPRKAVPKNGYQYSSTYPSDSIPDALKQAVCDIALALSQDMPETPESAVKRKKLDGVGEYEYFEPSTQETSGYGVDVADTIRHYIRPANRLVRV